MLGLLLGAAAGGLLVWLRQNEHSVASLEKEMYDLGTVMLDLGETMTAAAASIEGSMRHPATTVNYTAPASPDLVADVSRSLKDHHRVIVSSFVPPKPDDSRDESDDLLDVARDAK
ncbi:MAG TPA: hypothetical protein VK735_39925 [Pseudonocardia sp.]|uniref:hypothetical protein n=1 Tax=Pseudonocardia sp. TaxID=60912 RepID=UPI002C517F83|nr:hypothetical protein [Pseudonocardia sp.]HTF53653.1 hypothetical protein [Pseudonocardia sp.]